jgi:hypothetical protein
MSVLDRLNNVLNETQSDFSYYNEDHFDVYDVSGLMEGFVTLTEAQKKEVESAGVDVHSAVVDKADGDEKFFLSSTKVKVFLVGAVAVFVGALLVKKTAAGDKAMETVKEEVIKFADKTATKLVKMAASFKTKTTKEVLKLNKDKYKSYIMDAVNKVVSKIPFSRNSGNTI